MTDKNSFKLFLKIFILALFFAAGVLAHSVYRYIDVQKQCSERLIAAWSARFKYSITEGISETNIIGPFDVRFIGQYCPPDRPPVCPLNGELYGPFNIHDGPKCPNGHQIEKKNQKSVFMAFRGPRSKEEWMKAITDEDVMMRAAAAEWIFHVDFLSDEEKTSIVNKWRNDKDQYFRNLAADVLKGIRVRSQGPNRAPSENHEP